MHNALYNHNHNPASCRNPRPHIVHCTFGHNSALLYAITRSPRTKTLTFLHLLIWPLNKRARQTLRHQSDDHLSFDGKKSRMNWCCCASIYDTPPHTQPIVWWIQVVLTSWCRWAMLEEATYPTRYGRACDVETRTENTITGLRSVQRSTARYYKGLALALVMKHASKSITVKHRRSSWRRVSQNAQKNRRTCPKRIQGHDKTHQSVPSVQAW